MSKIRNEIYSRIGTCRSGTKFDLPKGIQKTALAELLSDFELEDQVDIMCMAEATLSVFRGRLDDLHEFKEVYRVSQFFLTASARWSIERELTKLGLVTSVDFVRHGLPLLLISK